MPIDVGVVAASNVVERDADSRLSPHHLDHLKQSAISLELIGRRCYQTIVEWKQLEALGFTKQQCRVPGILIPLWGVEGTGVVGYQFRPDSPRLNNRGKPIKYETPKGATNRLDCPPVCQKLLADPKIPLWITEGVKKGDALASLGECVIDLTGIWNWRAKNASGGITVSSDFDSIALNNRLVYLAPDSDNATNPSVSQAVRRLTEFLKRKKANVSIVLLPSGNNGSKTGVDDFLAVGHTLTELKALAVPAEEAVIADEQEELERNYVYANNRLYLEVRYYHGSYGFAYLDDQHKVKIAAELSLSGQTVKPRLLPRIEGKEIDIVGLPDEGISTARLLGADELYIKIREHLACYIDLPELDLELCVYYILFTWFYTKVKTLGYLRFLADTGKGKSRTQKVIGDLCFYPVFASGASSFSGIARLNNRWRGTLIMDEADTSGDKESQFVKYLNLGFESGKYYVLSDKQNPRLQEFFDPFSPKILAMRQPFSDNATEARVLSISPHETTNPSIPIILPDDYYTKMQRLRNEVALFTLHHFNTVKGSNMVNFNDLDIEPRLRQLAMPLSIVCQFWPKGDKLFRDYLVRRQNEVRKVRSQSWEGSLVNLVYGIAAGDTDLEDEFTGYYDAAGQVRVVTPTMVARLVKSSPKLVTQTLTSVGFELEWRWVELNRDDKCVKKRARAYCIDDPQTWAEIVSRYYYSDDGDQPREIPAALKSNKFHRVPGTVPSVPSVPETPGNNSHGTVGTLGTHYFTRDKNNGNKPTYSCDVCGSKNWWRRDGTWLCGRCHPEPQGEELLV
ncbi:MAG: DUF3854 domain-containing protein [Dehalococcoidales bacterium]|nr:DUF3854 domain-containing protein [Dehalococcoidales bacterium]